MFSIPPATTTSASPKRIACVANITAFIPEAQTLFTVVAGIVFGKPAFIIACLAGACPSPACNTFPIYTSSTKDPSKLILSKAPLIAVAPKSVAGTLDKLPKKDPIAVRTAETITTSFI